MNSFLQGILFLILSYVIYFILFSAIVTLARKTLEFLSRRVTWLSKYENMDLSFFTSILVGILTLFAVIFFSRFAINIPISSFPPTNTPISITTPLPTGVTPSTSVAAVTSVAVTSVAITSVVVVTPTPIASTPTPQIPIGTLATGRLEATYPKQMKVEEADVLTVEIITNARLTQLGTFPPNATGLISIEQRSSNGNRLRYESEITLYPVMETELQAENFEFLDTTKDARRFITPGAPIGWVWNIRAKRSGEQTVTLNVSGEVNQNGENIHALAKSISLNIDVKDKSIFEKISDALTTNVVTILGTGGPLGVIIAFLAYYSSKEKQKLQANIADLEEENKELHQYINSLRRKMPEPSDDLVFPPPPSSGPPPLPPSRPRSTRRKRS